MKCLKEKVDWSSKFVLLNKEVVGERKKMMQGFEQEALQTIHAYQLFPPNSRVLVACSGGVDSMVLLHFLAHHKKQLDIEIGAAYVDHMLRGEESAVDGKLVEQYCKRFEITFYGSKIPIPTILEERGGNVQMLCRTERYRFLEQTMKDATYNVLATAHHGEDQLETVLMQLTKGVTPYGMPITRMMASGRLVRPLMAFDKKTLYEYAAYYDVPFREDPSNQSDAYMRNRFRHRILPQMIEENPAVVQNILPLTYDLQEDDQYLQQQTIQMIDENIKFTSEGYPIVDVSYFRTMPSALQRRAIPLLLSYLYGKEGQNFYTSELLQLISVQMNSDEGNASLDLPQGFQLKRAYGLVTFERCSTLEMEEKLLPQGEKVEWGHDLWLYWHKIEDVDEEVLSHAEEITFFNISETSFPLVARLRQKGDRIALKGMQQKKKVARLFIDEKISQSLRERLPIIVTKENEVCAIPTMRYGKDFTKTKTIESKYIFIVGYN